MKKSLLFIFFVTTFLNIKSQVSLSFVNVNPNPVMSKGIVTYSFSGSGTDTIGVYVIDMASQVLITLRSNFVVSAGLYQDSIAMNNFPNGQYKIAFTHKTAIFYNKSFIKDITANTREIKLELPINIYPNPMKDKLVIEMGTAQATKIYIVNSLGKTVYTLEELSQKNEIDLIDFLSGIYIVKLFNNSEQKTFKIIKE